MTLPCIPRFARLKLLLFVGSVSGVGARQNPFSFGLKGLEENGRGWRMIFELLWWVGWARADARQRQEQGWHWFVPPFQKKEG
jgi:hypothetical protein